MALTYEESAALMRDATFISRVKVACLHYADYISNEPTGTPAHVSRLRWASNVFVQPDNVAMQTAPPAVMDGAVQEAGSAITDEALQSAVEGVVNKMM